MVWVPYHPKPPFADFLGEGLLKKRFLNTWGRPRQIPRFLLRQVVLLESNPFLIYLDTEICLRVPLKN